MNDSMFMNQKVPAANTTGTLKAFKISAFRYISAVRYRQNQEVLRPLICRLSLVKTAAYAKSGAKLMNPKM